MSRRPPGRPTAYDPKYCEMLIKHCQKGRTFDAFAILIGVHVDTLYEWAQKNPEFSDAKKKAKSAAEDYMYQIGMAGMMGKIKGFSTGAWAFMMKARFGWSEDGPPVEHEDADLEFV